jgi:hypothetical protein
MKRLGNRCEMDILYINVIKDREKAGKADNFLWDIQERYVIMKSHEGTLYQREETGQKPLRAETPQ